MKTRPLVGFKSLQALNVFSTLMMGLKMLPAYRGETYEAFLERIQAMPEDDQRNMIRQAAVFVDLKQEEVEALASFAEDANGIQYGPANLKSMGPVEIVDLIVAVCMEIAKIKVNLVTEDEKKK